MNRLDWNKIWGFFHELFPFTNFSLRLSKNSPYHIVKHNIYHCTCFSYLDTKNQGGVQKLNILS